MSCLFDSLDVWYDDLARTGAENMAVDQMLMENVVDRPLLRVYEWSEPSVSFGYFLPLLAAVSAFPGEKVNYVRRWTGGGVVDHRVDVTYTLVIPRGHSLASMRGGGSYREIHSVLAQVLVVLGQRVRVESSDLGDGRVECFANPVAFDVTDQLGCKVAGAGQRRSKYGLLHQGSVIADVDRRVFFDHFTRKLSDDRQLFSLPEGWGCRATDLARQRYATEEWLKKR